MILLRSLLSLIVLLAAGCGGGGGAGGASTPPPPLPDVAAADIRILMFGNSHTDFNNLPGMVAAMLRSSRPGKSVAVVQGAQYMHLQERLLDSASLAQFNSQPWNAVVFQAQNYSLSGQTVYSTTEAVEWVRMTRARSAIPVMFPEWARLGVDETELVYGIHVGIAQRQPACVAPIPQAWDLALARYPAIRLHAGDGNHAVAAGSFLAALVIYATLTREAPAALPLLASLNVDADTQARLREIADEQVRLVSPRQYCPTDGKI